MPGVIENLATEGAACLGAPARERYWKEISIEEKIERLRSLLKEVDRQTGQVTVVAHNALALARDHQHGSTGGVLVSASAHGNQCESPVGRIRSNPSNPDAVYI